MLAPPYLLGVNCLKVFFFLVAKYLHLNNLKNELHVLIQKI